MIKQLTIKNLVLIDSCEVSFAGALTCITGETGAGKTALIQSIHLLLGQKADSSLVRKGHEKGFVQASFCIDNIAPVKAILQESGICLEEEDLLISREISTEGKSRAFINNQMVSVALLQRISPYLVQIIGQHSYHEIRSLEMQRHLLDLFGSLEEEVAAFSLLYEKQKLCQQNLLHLKEKNEKKAFEIDLSKRQLYEIEEASWKEGEEETLLEEYTFFSKAADISAKIGEIVGAFSSPPKKIIPSLSHYKNLCENLSSCHPVFSECQALLTESIIALQEVDHLLSKQLDRLEQDPHKLTALEERLDLLNKIKKKYGSTFVEIQTKTEELRQKLQSFASIEEQLLQAEADLLDAEEKLQKRSLALTEKRRQASIQYEKALTEEISQLNMNGAKITIEVSAQERGPAGADKVQFWLSANIGEHPVTVKDGSSGGELSRLLLAIKILLAGKNSSSTLIFDEIDANVGGETATRIAEKMLKLSTHRQVICITHFPQVAIKAGEHIHVYKRETEGRTIAHLEKLSGKEREKELLRMLGGEKTLLFS